MTQQQFTEQYSFDLRKDKIGGGSFGTVYKAYDNINDIEVAIKVSEVKFVGDKEFSLLEEYNAVKNLSAHANIANYNSVQRFESFQGIFDYALMQYYPLGNLSHYLKNNTVSKEDREKLVMGILEGIAFLHKNKVVHRDLKPSNILVVNRKGQLIPKITDFGLSKQASADTKGSRFTNSFAGGTLQYSSPEQIKGLPLKLNTDLWSFGAIAFEILTGNTLFETQSNSTATAEWQKEITNMILHEDVSSKLTDLDSNWQNAITACLQRDLSKRIQSTAAITGLLNGTDQFKIPTETVIPPISTADTEIKPNTDAKKQSVKSASATQPIPKPKQKKWLVPVAALVVVLLSFTGYKLFNTNTDTQVVSLQLFEENGVYGYKLGDSIAIPAQYTKAHSFTDNQALVSTADSSYYINNTGNWASKYVVAEAVTDSTSIAENDAIDTTTDNSTEDTTRKTAEEEANKKEQQRIALAKADKDAYDKAKGINTKTAYQSYVQQYPNGKYKQQAKSAITTIDNAERDRLAKIEEEKKANVIEDLDELYTRGNNFYSNKNYKEAYPLLLKCANAGNPEAQHRIGWILTNGEGGKSKNPKEGFKWYMKAANQGKVSSLNNVGNGYRKGLGVTKNLSKALDYLQRASENGDETAANSLGLMYTNGEEVTKDIDEAISWFKKAYNNGDKYYAPTNLGDIYFSNKLGKEDNQLALEWYKKAANQGNRPFAMVKVGEIYDKWLGNGEDVDWKEAVKWYKKAADKGSASGKRLLGEFYLFGVGGVSKNVSTAKQLFREASSKGDEKSKQYLEVLDDVSKGKSKLVKTSNFGNKLFLTQEEIDGFAEYPWVITKYGVGFGIDVSYSLGESSYIGGIFPAQTSASGKRFSGETVYTNYSSSSTYITSSGQQRASLSYKKESGQGNRSIGYMYVRAYFNDPDETLILKIPYIVCTKPKNEY